LALAVLAEKYRTSAIHALREQCWAANGRQALPSGTLEALVVAALSVMSTRRALPESPYLAAVAGRKPHRMPVWFMRQAGRSLPEYRALREQHSMMAACFDPELIAEITLQPVRRHDVDAAILFSDIVVPLRGAGVDLDIVADVGPVMAA